MTTDNMEPELLVEGASELLITYPLMASIQLVCARMGRVTGSGLATNLRRHYPAPLLYLAVLILLTANIINIAADLAAMAAAKLVIGGPVQLYVALFGTASLLMPRSRRCTGAR